MSRLSRYVTVTVLMSMVLVQVLLLGLDVVFSFIGELDDVNGSSGVWPVFVYVLLQLPHHVYEILPMSALVGALVGLGTLASSSELTVMRAAGISTVRIIWWVIRGALVVIAFGLALGEFVVPITDQRADIIMARHEGHAYQPGRISGYWQREGNDLVNIRLVTQDGELLGLARYREAPDRTLLESSFAESADYVDKAWQLHNVYVTTYLPNGNAQVSTRASDVWQTALTPNFLRVASTDADRLRLGELRTYITYLKKQSLDTGRYELEFWKKVLSPLAVFSMVLVACSFIFGPLRSVTLGQRIITGVLVGIVFRYGQEACGYSSLLFHMPPMIAVLVPILICLGAGMYALGKVR